VGALVPELKRPGARRIERPVLVGERARFVGEPVAAVVAESPYLAEDAAEAIEIDYEPMPAIASIEDALNPELPALHGHDNVIFREEREEGDVAAAFASADVVVERTFRNPRYSAAPMENRGVLAVPDGDGLLLWSGTQIPHILEETLADVLGLEGRVRVRCPDIGGGFGQKAHVFPEEIAVGWAAMRLGRPVKWVEDRRENLLGSAHAREQMVRARAAADRNGRLLAVDAEVYCDVGAYGIFPWGQLLEALGTPAILPGPYALRNYRYVTHSLATNKAPQGAYRGVGLPVSAFVHERMMDLLAGELDLDRGEIRRVNFVPSEDFPYATVSGLRYDSGNYEAALDAALEGIGYESFDEQREAAAREGRRLGLGIASYVEWTGTNSETYIGRGMSNVRGYDAGRVPGDRAGRGHDVLADRRRAPGGAVRPGANRARGYRQLAAGQWQLRQPQRHQRRRGADLGVPAGPGADTRDRGTDARGQPGGHGDRRRTRWRARLARRVAVAGRGGGGRRARIPRHRRALRPGGDRVSVRDARLRRRGGRGDRPHRHPALRGGRGLRSGDQPDRG
jgi:carbon-monoxide dehydrogenase large subunit